MRTVEEAINYYTGTIEGLKESMYLPDTIKGIYDDMEESTLMSMKVESNPYGYIDGFPEFGHVGKNQKFRIVLHKEGEE